MPKPKHTLPPTRLAFPERDSISRFAAVLATSGQRLAQLQNEAVDIAFAEMAERHQQWLKNLSRGAEILSWPSGNGERMASLVQEWLGVVTQTQAAWLETMVDCLPATQIQLVEADIPVIERRVRSVVIDFPDRRLAA